MLCDAVSRLFRFNSVMINLRLLPSSTSARIRLMLNLLAAIVLICGLGITSSLRLAQDWLHNLDRSETEAIGDVRVESPGRKTSWTFACSWKTDRSACCGSNAIGR